ncbi:hypothetical protein C8F01DRAFT_1266693 [Mycena amicta]|nr:hypothetical protein C8F01DRAFT_1266693 [Mycena amicta]
MSEPVTILITDLNFDPHSTNQPSGFFPKNDVWPSVFNDSMFVPDPAPLGQGIPWVLDLDGVSISLFGVSPPADPAYNQTIAISNPFDPNANSTLISSYTPYTYPSPAFGGQLLTTGRLSVAGPMKLGLTGFRGIALNYALVEVGEFTSLTGFPILLDDSSQEIAWNGGWTVKSDYGTTMQVQCELPVLPHNPNVTGNVPLVPPFTATMVPHGNSTHVSSATGDSFTFPFAGTSLSLYGIPPGPVNDENWQLKMQFSIDGTNNSTATFTASQFPVYAPHFLYYSSPALSAGNHTLTATVLDVAGSANPAAQIDYLVYTPTFVTVHDKPVFPVSSGVVSSASPSSTGRGGGVGLIAKSKPSKAGPIAGGVIAGLVILVVLVFLALLLRRRKRNRDAEMPPVDLTQEPFLGMPSVSRMSASGSAQQSYPQSSASFVSSSALSPQRAQSPSSSALGRLIIPSQKSQQTRTLAEQRDELAQEIRRLGAGAGPDASESSGASADVNVNAGGNSVQLEARVQELQSQMEVLTREMRYQQMVPPEYEEGDRAPG